MKERIYPVHPVFVGQHLVDGDFRRMFLLPWTRLKEKRVLKSAPSKSNSGPNRKKANKKGKAMTVSSAVKHCDMCNVKKPLHTFPTVGQQKGKVCLECQRMDAGIHQGSNTTLPPTVHTSPVTTLRT